MGGFTTSFSVKVFFEIESSLKLTKIEGIWIRSLMEQYCVIRGIPKRALILKKVGLKPLNHANKTF